MWELVNRFSRGRYPGRHILLLAITGLMTIFVASLTHTTPVYADDVTRSGDTITYQGNVYSEADSDIIPKDVLAKAPTTQAYYYTDDAAGKAYFIFTAGDRTTATVGNYVIYDFTPPANFSNPSPPVDVTFVTTDADASEDAGSCSDSSLTGIGWYICPIANFIATGMDKIYGIIADFLVVRTVTTDTNAPLFQMWAVVRDIANICFVIALLIIVYSQITSIGISNYGLKKTLPRLIIAAILVNISYWICTVGVDISNILGYSIHNMFMGLVEKFSTGAGYNNSMPSWSDVTYVALGGAGVVIGGLALLNAGVTAAPFLLLPFLVGGLLAVLVALIVLAARQALITVLIIIAPLAFVAYVLPNTEKWFTKWRETLTTMLLLFPIFSAVFSGAQLAGVAIIQSSGGNIFTVILGLGTQVAPIVITPLLIKFSGGLIGKIAGIVNNPSKGLVDRTRNWAQGAAQERKNKILSDQTRMAKSKRFGHLANNPISRATKGLNNYGRYRDGRRKAYESMAENAFDDTKYGRRVKTMNRDSANDKKDIEDRYMKTEDGRRTEIRSRHLDINKTETENDLMRSNAGKYITYRQGMAEADKTRVHNEFEESSFGHKLDTAKRTVELEKKRIENTHQAAWDTSVRTDPGLYNLNLSVKASEAKAAVAKAKLEKVDAEVLAQGSGSEHILNLRGVDMHTQAGMLNIAHDLKRDTLEAAVAGTAKGMADRVTAEYKTKALTDNTITVDGKTIVEYAGGIKGLSGRNAVIAKAKSEESAVLMEDIKNIQSTMDYTESTNNNKLYTMLKSTDDLAQKIAYVKAMSKNGGPGIGKLREVLSELGDDGGGIVPKEKLQVFKEILADESRIMSAGKDIEFFLTNSAHLDATGNVEIKPDGSPHYKTFDELKNDRGTWKNLSPAAFAGQNISTQMFALEKLYHEDHPAYMRIVNGIRTNPGALSQVKQGVIDKFSIYSDAVVKAMKAEGLNPVVGEMKVGP